MLERYDKYRKYELDKQLAMVVDRANKTIKNCPSCGWTHEGVEIQTDTFGEFFICQMNKKEVGIDA